MNTVFGSSFSFLRWRVDAAGWPYPLIAVLAAILIFPSCKTTTVREATRMEPVIVKVEPLIRKEISIPVRSAGMVATSEEIRLSFKTGGIISRAYVREGDPVKRGQLLAVLDLSEINAQVTQARNACNKAQRDHERAVNLFADSVATLEQLQNAETALNVSKSVLDAALFNLSHSKIVAPESGIILKQLAREHEMVSPGYPVYAMGVTGKNWIVRTGLPDRDVVRINRGDSAFVRIDAWPDMTFPAIVSQMDEAPNPLTGTYEIELLLKETPDRIASGFIAGAEIHPSQKTGCWLVPVEAMMEADGLNGYVYRPVGDTVARKVPVEIITLVGDQAAVTGALENITRVVTKGAAYLSDNAPIRIQK